MKDKRTLTKTCKWSCSVCKSCTLFTFDNGDMECPYGGPYSGYIRDDSSLLEERIEGEDSSRGSWHGQVLVHSSVPSEKPILSED